MKNKFNIIAALAFSVLMLSAMPGDGTITREGNTTIVTTTTLCRKVKGYMGATPVKIYIVKNKVVKVEALRNQESPQYNARAKKLLETYAGKSVSKARKLQVDAVTGATYTSKALIRNVQKGLEYYVENK